MRSLFLALALLIAGIMPASAQSERYQGMARAYGSGGGGGGTSGTVTIATGQVGYGTGTNAIGGDTGLTYTGGNTFNLAGTSSGQVGQYLAPRGSVSAPSFAFGNDPNTGMWNTTGDNLGFVTGGSNRFNLSNAYAVTSVPLGVNNAGFVGGVALNVNGASIINGAVTVASGSSPSTALDVYGDVSASGVINLAGTRIMTNISNSSIFMGSGAGNNGGTNSTARNIALGSGSLGSLTGGTANTFMGHQNAINLTNTSNNVGVGYLAMRLGTGNQNTMLGSNAGAAQLGGDGNIYIGYNTGGFSNTASNQLNIGNTIYGDMLNNRVGIGVSGTPSATWHVSGTMLVTSDTTFNSNVTFTGGNIDASATPFRTTLTSGRILVTGGNGYQTTTGNLSWAQTAVGRGTIAINQSTVADIALGISGTLQLTSGTGITCSAAQDGSLRSVVTLKTIARCDGATGNWYALASTTTVVAPSTN